MESRQRRLIDFHHSILRCRDDLAFEEAKRLCNSYSATHLELRGDHLQNFGRVSLILDVRINCLRHHKFQIDGEAIRKHVFAPLATLVDNCLVGSNQISAETE